MRPAQTVLLDANVLIRDRWLTSAEWGALVREARDEICEIHVPEIVVREAVGHHRRELERHLASAQSSARDARRLRALVTIEMDVDAEVEVYEEHLRRALEDAAAWVDDLPRVDIMNLVDRAIARHPPFDDRGSGFRDALIWEHAIDLFPTRLTLVTDDSDFRHDDALAPALTADLEARAVGEWEFDLRRNLAEYIKNRRAPTPGLKDEVRASILRQEPYLLERIRQLIEEGTVATEGLIDLDTQIVGADEPFDLALDEAYAAEDDSSVFVEMHAYAGVTVEVYLWRGPHLTVDDYGRVEVTATFDRGSGELHELTIEPVEFRLESHLDAAGVPHE